MGNGVSIDIGGLIFGCWDRCSERATSLRQLENNIENLRKQRDELTAKRDDILERVRIEEARHMVQLQEVEVWRTNVDAAIAEANNLISTGPQEIEKLCLGGCCSKNCVSSITFERRIIERLQHTTALYSRNFVVVAQPRPLVMRAEIPGDQPLGLDVTFDKVWRCLVEENIGIVGLWGMGGVGKTTLVKQIYNRFYATSKDLELVWVVVSRDFNLDKLQKDIGEKLGLRNNEQWKKQTPDEKAAIIYNALLSKKFVLILDDLWQSVDLKEVGVPTNQSESKIIFTTRSESICGKMCAQEIIKVEPLTPERAWQLFRKNIKEDILEIPGIRPLAEDVARECNGLPLALVTISGAMSRKKALKEWNYAREVLRNSASKFEDVEVRVFSKLKFSFDNLPNDMARSCFLYCSLFPEDYKIEKDDLIDYLISEELIKREDDGIDLRDKGYNDIGDLIRVSLLEEEGEYVKMHDVIRDMALWIVRSHEDAGERFFVRTGAQLIKLPSVGEWQGVKRMSLMRNKIETMDEVPVCHNLSTMFLSDNPLVSMHDNFFQFMNALTVLDLSRTNLVELPLGITNLVSLQSLSLCYTRIRELPLELKRLVKLKCLNIEHTSGLVIIPRNLLSSLKLLQILRMMVCEYFKIGEQEGSQVLGEEVPLLEHLSVLSVTVCDAATLQQLPSCSIHALHLFNFRGVESLDISLLTEMKGLAVNRSNSLREFNVSFMRGGKAQATSSMYTSTIVKEPSFNSLRVALFTNCHRLQHLTWLILAPNLTSLAVFRCKSMTEVISAEKLLQEIPEAGGNRNPFGKLKSLELSAASNLKSIYWEALPFPSLKNILVLGCPSLKTLPLDSNSAKDCKLVIQGEDSWWNDVEWEDEAIKSYFQPCFVPLSPL